MTHLPSDLSPVRRPAGPAVRDLPGTGPDRCFLVVEIADFDDPGGEEELRELWRQVLYRLLRRAFDDAGIGWSACAFLDRGDAYLMIAPPAVPAASLAGPLLGLLHAGLALYNRYASAAARLRLRAGLHSGPAGTDADAVRHAERLASCAPARAALRGAEADLALVASDPLYADAVRHGDGAVDPAAYRPIVLGDGGRGGRDDRIRGWVALPAPGHPPSTRQPNGDGLDGRGWPGGHSGSAEGAEPATAGHPGVTVPMGGASAFGFFGNVTFGGDAVAGDKIVYT